MDDKFLILMEQSIQTNKHICDSYRHSLEMYKKIVELIVYAFVVCIIVMGASFMYSNYVAYNYEGYPETEILNSNTSNSNSSSENNITIGE